MAGGDAELEHLGAEVVEVAADARLRLDARVELVAALRGGRRRAHAQRVEVVGHRRVVVVLGQEADREVHRAAHLLSPADAGAREVALGDVLVDARQLLLGLFAYPGQLGAVGQRAALEV